MMHASFDADAPFMLRAIELAREAVKHGEVPVGAVVVHEGLIIAEAFNRRELDHDPTAHAERLALTQAGQVLGSWRLDSCTMYVTLEPCAMCAGAAVLARLGRLVYGAIDPKAGACESLYRIASDARLNHRPELLGGVLAETCGEVLREFFRARRTPRVIETSSERASF